MKESAGILLYRQREETEFLLVHPGGPFFARKHEGWWTIPKGELLTDEAPLDAALREFEEETGYKPPPPFIELQPVVQKAGKKVFCWASEGDLDPALLESNTFEMEWPPKSGKKVDFPEVDKAEWLTLADAKRLINERQAALLDELITILSTH